MNADAYLDFFNSLRTVKPNTPLGIAIYEFMHKPRVSDFNKLIEDTKKIARENPEMARQILGTYSFNCLQKI